MSEQWLVGPEHVRLYEESDGAIGHDWSNGIRCLVLRTIGRRSGQVRKKALIYGEDVDGYVVIASKGGAPHNPEWYENLVANPGVEIQVGADVLSATGRTAVGEDRDRAWALMVDQWPLFEEYQAKTARQIPVVILTPY